jgi:CBS domain-containing protein
MTKKVIVAQATTSFKEMAQLMAENRVRGVPVLAPTTALWA